MRAVRDRWQFPIRAAPTIKYLLLLLLLPTTPLPSFLAPPQQREQKKASTLVRNATVVYRLSIKKSAYWSRLDFVFDKRACSTHFYLGEPLPNALLYSGLSLNFLRGSFILEGGGSLGRRSMHPRQNPKIKTGINPHRTISSSWHILRAGNVSPV